MLRGSFYRLARSTTNYGANLFVLVSRPLLATGSTIMDSGVYSSRSRGRTTLVLRIILTLIPYRK